MSCLWSRGDAGIHRLVKPRCCWLHWQVYRDSSKLLSEAGYVLTQVVSAVCFLEDVDASVLSIAHGDFERGLKGFTENARVGLKAHQLQVSRNPWE